MTLIILFLTITAVCIGAALYTIGSTCIGLLLALIAVAIGTTSATIRDPFDIRDLSDRTQTSGAPKARHIVILFARSARLIVPIIIGTVAGAALIFLVATFYVAPQ
jgi:hypothetical protein